MNASKECRHKLADVENMRKLYVVCDDMLTSRAPEQLIKQILSIMNRALPLGSDFYHYVTVCFYQWRRVEKSVKVSPPYQLIDAHKPTQKDSEEEIIPVLEQFPNLKLFDKFLTESDTFLNRCLGDEKKSCHDNLLQVTFSRF